MADVRITRQARALIGDIVLVAARLDHLITIAFLKLTKLDQLRGFVLTDKMSISTKFAKIQYLVEANEDKETAERLDNFLIHMTKFLRVRNALAHGILAYREGKDFHFLVTSDYVTDDKGKSFGARTSIFDHAELATARQVGENLCLEIQDLFGVRPMHELQPSILRPERPPSPRSLRKKSAVKPKPPPRSS